MIPIIVGVWVIGSAVVYKNQKKKDIVKAVTLWPLALLPYRGY